MLHSVLVSFNKVLEVPTQDWEEWLRSVIHDNKTSFTQLM